MHVKMVFVCLSPLLLMLICGSESQRIMNTMEENRFNGFLSSKTVAILRNHSCEPHLQRKRETRGMARWTYVTLNCARLSQNQISSVLCDKVCLDPVSCKKMPKLKGVAVLRGQRIRSSNNEKYLLDLPVACQCRPKNESSETCENRR